MSEARAGLGAAVAATAFFVRAGARNRLRRLVARAHRPRDLVAVLLALLVLGGALDAWVVFALLRPPLTLDPGATWLAACTFLGVVFGCMGVQVRELGIGLSRAELSFLLGAPVSRRGVLAFLLLRQQPGVAIGAGVAALLGLVVLRGSAIAWALLLAYLALGCVSLAALAARQLGASAAARGASPTGLIPRLPGLLLIGVPLASHLTAVPALFAPDRRAALAGWFHVWAATPVAWPVFAARAPFDALLRGDDLACGTSAAALLGIDLALLAFVLRDPAPLEEASLDLAARLEVSWTAEFDAFKHMIVGAPRRSPPSERRLEVPWPLAPLGSPVWALVWKQLIASGRARSPRRLARWLLGALLAGVLLGEALAGTSAPPFVAMAALVAACVWAAVPFLRDRLGLTSELRQLATLRALPLSGRDLLTGVTLGPWLLICAAWAVGLVFAAGACSGWTSGPGGTWHPIRWSTRGVAALAAWFLFAGFMFLSLAAEAVQVLVLPTWTPTTSNIQRSLGRSGAGTLIVVALLLATVGAAVLPVGAAYALLGWATNGWLAFAIPAAVLAAALMIGEGLWLLRRMSARWDGFDLSEVPG